DVFDEVLTEGYLSVPVPPYPLPYRVLLPRRDECSNLLVSTCVSASHIAFASFRMEPQLMIAGHAAGTAATLAVEADSAVHDVDVGRLQSLLRAEGQILQPPGR
nr:FAD-dependent oxidoreductase [Euzebyales bacterium]